MINKLTKEQIDSNKKEILTLLGNVKRKGMDEVMSFLKNSTFFVASNHRDNKKHHAWPGGIAQHSLGVYKLMKDARGLDHDSITITSLLHDSNYSAPYYMISCLAVVLQQGMRCISNFRSS